MESEAPRPSSHRGFLRQLWFWVLVAIVSGTVFGLVAPDTAKDAKWLADAFVQLVKTITAPVIFLTVVVGIASLGSLARAGGLAARALGYFLAATIIALALGLLAGNLVKPGAGFSGEPSKDAAGDAKESIAEAGDAGTGIVGFITEDLLPTSFVQPFVENEVLKVLRARDPRRGRDLRARAGAAQARRRRLRDRQQDHLRRHPHDHVGRAARRLRRHGVHRRAVRRRRAGEPRHAAGHLLGHGRGVRLRRARARRAPERLLDPEVHPAASRTSC